MSDEAEQTPDLEALAKEIASDGVASKSTSVDGVSVSKTALDPEKVLNVADRLDARTAAKNPARQIRFLKIKD